MDSAVGCHDTWDDQNSPSATSKYQYTCGSASRQHLTRTRWPLGVSYSKWREQQRESLTRRHYCKACTAEAEAAAAAAAVAASSPPPSLLHVTVEDEEKDRLPVHENFFCDGCRSAPIVGTRYRCAVCPQRPGFDLCSACYERGGLHPADHALSAFVLPLPPRPALTEGSGAAASLAHAVPAVISRLLPDSGLVSERTRILIAGENFLRGSVVRIGDLPCSDVVVLSSSVIACVSPASLPEGELMVTVAHPAAPSAAAVLDDAFYAYRDPSQEELEVVMLDPSEGPSRGDTHLELTVRGMMDGAVSVAIGGVDCINVVRLPGTATIRCVTGRALDTVNGRSDVRVTNAGRSVILPEGYRYVPAVEVALPGLEVVLVEPASAAAGSTVEITVAGLLDDGGAVSVSVGGVACEVVWVDAEEARVYCQLGSHAAGEADVVVRQGRNVASLARAFTYESSLQPHSELPQRQPQQPQTRLSPRAGLSAVSAAAVSVFRPYRGSEAEDLARAHQARLGAVAWLSSAVIQGERVDIDSSAVPRAQTEVYTIIDARLAQRCGLSRGDSLSQADILAHRNSEELVSALMDERLIARTASGLNPDYHPCPVSPQEQRCIDQLRAAIRQRIAERDRGGQRVAVDSGGRRGGAERPVLRWYVGQHSTDGTLHVNDNPYDSEQLGLLLAAVAANQEEQAQSSIINLACNFDYQHAEAKRAFIDAFTCLFITKQFPSLGIRQFYFHCILRCGHIE